MQCGAVITRSILSKILTKDTPQLARKGEVCGVFVSLMFDLCSAIVIAVLNIISWQIWPRYKGNRLYIAYRWLSARLQNLQRVSDGDAAVLH